MHCTFSNQRHIDRFVIDDHVDEQLCLAHIKYPIHSQTGDFVFIFVVVEVES